MKGGENNNKSCKNILLPCVLKGRVWHLMGCQCAASVDCCSLRPYKETKLTKDTTDYCSNECFLDVKHPPAHSPLILGTNHKEQIE